MDWLRKTEDALHLEDSVVTAARLECYKGVIWEALADHALTSEEELLLEQVRSVLSIDDSSLQDERDALSQARRASALSQELPRVDAS